MICPQCGKRNTLGVERCRYCRRAFTRSAAQPGITTQPAATTRPQVSAQQGFDPRPPERRVPLSQPAPAAYASHSADTAWEDDDVQEPYPAPVDRNAYAAAYTPRAGRTRRRSSRNGCLLAFGVFSVLLVGGLVALLLAATMIVQPRIRDAAVADIGDGVRDEVARQITTQIGDSASGDIVISEQEINERLDGQVDLGPLSSANVQITPEGLLIELSAYGLNGSYRAQVVDQNGSVAIVGSPMQGPLAYIMPEGDIEDAVNAALATALSDAGYYVEQVATAQGAITLTLAQ